MLTALCVGIVIDAMNGANQSMSGGTCERGSVAIAGLEIAAINCGNRSDQLMHPYEWPSGVTAVTTTDGAGH